MLNLSRCFGTASNSKGLLDTTLDIQLCALFIMLVVRNKFGMTPAIFRESITPSALRPHRHLCGRCWPLA